jgi:hypothetical protein
MKAHFSAFADFEGSYEERLLCGDNQPLSVQGLLTGYCGRLDREKSTLTGLSIISRAAVPACQSIDQLPCFQGESTYAGLGFL